MSRLLNSLLHRSGFHALLGRFGLRPEPEGNGGSERHAGFYDEMFATSGEYALPYYRSRYYFMWTVIADRARRAETGSVLEVGCGSGQLAHLLFEQGIRTYTGIDFSSTAIEQAMLRVPQFRFLVEDARSPRIYKETPCDLLICTEVLEHIQDDLKVLQNVPEGTSCICTVPSFPYRSHVRHFESCDEVRDRYARFFRGFDVMTMRRPDREVGCYYLFEGTRTHQPS